MSAPYIQTDRPKAREAIRTKLKVELDSEYGINSIVSYDGQIIPVKQVEVRASADDFAMLVLTIPAIYADITIKRCSHAPALDIPPTGVPLSLRHD